MLLNRKPKHATRNPLHLLLEGDGVGARGGVLHSLEVVQGHAKPAQHTVAQLLQLAQHFILAGGRGGRGGGRVRVMGVVCFSGVGTCLLVRIWSGVVCREFGSWESW